MNVAGYVRVSSDAQTENYSIPQQKELIESYCKARQWDLIKVYIDGGYTGANTERPALKELISDLKVYNMVLVYKLDRLSRSQKDTLQLIEIFSQQGVKFTSIQENFDTSTPLGMAMVGILSTFAQLEREQIKERMSLGRRGRTQKGLWRAGSNVPTGYNYIDGHLVVREDEAIQIRKIFDLFLQGYSIHKIKEYMHANYTNRYSSWAQASAVSTVLRNPLYIGMLPSRANGEPYQGEHEPIIDKNTFDAVQKLLKARAEQYNERPFAAKHLLTGLLYCAECGGRVSCVGSHKYMYYGCHRKHDGDPRHKIKPKCKTPNYNVKKLDKIIIDEVLKLSYDENAIKAHIRPKKKKDNSKPIKQLEKQKNRLIDLYTVQGIDIDTLTKKINDINTKIEQLKDDNNDKPDLSFEDAKKIFENVEKILFDSDNILQQKAILQALIKKILLDGDNITIYWRFE